MIKCCRDCVPPKRHSRCWSTCPEYIKEKAQEDERREAERIRREVYGALDDQKEKMAIRAMKKRNRFK